MAVITNSDQFPTLLDVAKRMDPDGKIDKIAEMLSQDNEVLDDMPWFEGNLPTGHRVTVRTGLTGDSQVRLAISDDGPSIPVAERQRIFERFHRLLGTQEDGSGLGLAIVSEIATLHGAEITLEEDVDGVGNTFSVFFRSRED